MKFIINCKTYTQGTGKNALKLLKQLETLRPRPIVCLQAADLHLAKKTKCEVWAQHLDPITPGSHTGWLLPETLLEYGVKGTLLNHSEHRSRHARKTIKRCKELGLKTMILVPSAADVKRVRRYGADCIGVEPPALIGSKTLSVASRPRLIKKAVQLAHDTPLYIGAGVHSKEDIQVGRELGSEGVLIASAVVKAKNPKKVLQSLYRG